jgi:hypothetical protein
MTSSRLNLPTQPETVSLFRPKKVENQLTSCTDAHRAFILRGICRSWPCQAQVDHNRQ